jgi:hypothetical protein
MVQTAVDYTRSGQAKALAQRVKRAVAARATAIMKSVVPAESLGAVSSIDPASSSSRSQDATGEDQSEARIEKKHMPTLCSLADSDLDGPYLVPNGVGQTRSPRKVQGFLDVARELWRGEDPKLFYGLCAIWGCLYIITALIAINTHH